MTYKIFQSTPPRRRRRERWGCFTCHKYFNPRLREGGDFNGSPAIARAIISIHASEKEATKVSSCLLFETSKFQSTPPRRRRLQILQFSIIPYKFQSTPPRRRRRICRTYFFVFYNFNPRLREGGDGIPICCAAGNGISIHASEKEATNELLGKGTSTLYFNPRLREGGDGNIL